MSQSICQSGWLGLSGEQEGVGGRGQGIVFVSVFFLKIWIESRAWIGGQGLVYLMLPNI